MKILFVGPLIYPVHGQSLAFTRLVESLKINEKYIINTNGEDYDGVRKVFFSIQVLFFIFIKLTVKKFDTVYFTCSRSFLGSLKDILLINLASVKGSRIINHLHGSDFYDFLHGSPKWYKKLLIHSYNKVDTSIVLLERMRDQFQDFQNMTVEVVPNFYDNSLNESLENKNINEINLVYLSNIMCSKGIFDLISAFKLLATKYTNVHLYIAGGYIADKYMGCAEIKDKFLHEISGHSRIVYLGKVFGDEKIKLLQRSDIFVLPTYYDSEAFPISIIEGMACGNAIVTTNYKYLPDVVTAANGVLIEPKSIESLVSGIEVFFKNNEKLRSIQLNNKLHAKDNYSIEQYINSLNSLLMNK
ncbi:glycosyltransferase family 4 protein [Pseudoalteromonas sp. MMG006]|uniref:glycosyltransferase family 4 protein n=1 Tax=Pseudoalteromonas sp. MMG006 TaxID=2822683 RepID=UPI001B37B685|nr:glycosyltransferase family 4 protein [Pseudoalteromonas sp. MMG006]MBQ4799521.1 glycosyltransferase family 4 protein [Pseudoalteromonas sp. MMG006]